MNVILFSLYCLLSYLSLVMLSCSYVNVILSSLYCLLSYLSLVMLSLLLCECHLVFPLLSFVILITCYVKFAPMWMSSCLPSIVFCHTYHLLLSFSCVNVNLSSLYCLLSYLSLVMLISYVNVILSYFSCLLSYLSLVMLSLLLCECHLVFPLLSFVILIICYVKFAPMWMSSCFPSIVFCHTYHLLC